MKALLIGIIALMATSLTFAANQGVSHIEKSAVSSKAVHGSMILASEAMKKKQNSGSY